MYQQAFVALVALRMFATTSLGFLRVGHTHDDVGLNVARALAKLSQSIPTCVGVARLARQVCGVSTMLRKYLLLS
jgi:hypothetical protein